MFSLVLKNNYRKNDYNRKLFLKTLFKKIIFKNCFKNHYRSHSNWLPNHLFLSNEMGKSGEMTAFSFSKIQKKEKKRKENQQSEGSNISTNNMSMFGPLQSQHAHPAFPCFTPLKWLKTQVCLLQTPLLSALQ